MKSLGVIFIQLNNLVIHLSPMLNRIHAPLKRNAHTFRALHMSGNLHSNLMRFIADRRDLVHRHLQSSSFPNHLGIRYAARHTDFDPVHTVLHINSCIFAHFPR
ncbi:hypothetical protein D3C74_378470 [compost metagenome]